MSPTRALAMGLLALALGLRTADAQARADTGRVEPLRLLGVFDDKTGAWIEKAIVRDTLGSETLTSKDGVATLNVLAPIAGFYLLEIRKEGYAPRRIQLRADTTVEVMLALSPRPLGDATQLPAVVTTARRRIMEDPGERRGFFERCQAKAVQCIGRAELDRQPVGTLDNLLGRKTGVHRQCKQQFHGVTFNSGPADRRAMT